MDSAGRQRTRPVGVAAVVAATVATAVAGSRGGDFDSAWYARLRKPPWQPSATAIGAVWAALYTLMAVAASLVWWRRGAEKRTRFWAVLALQYALNAASTPIFTRLRALRLATLDSALLTLSAVTLAVLAWSVRRLAALLLAPYAL